MLTLVLSFALGAGLSYGLTELGNRHRWAPAAADRREVGTARAPRSIRRLALWSFLMGQLFVPGLLMGLLGVVFGAGIGLVSIPGLILAARIWRLGFWFLRRDPRAIDEARRVERFALTLDAITLVLLVPLGVLLGDELAWLMVMTAVYTAISIAHAYCLGQAADLLERMGPAHEDLSPGR